MKLENARQAYYEYSGKLSTINRQLALSGIAIVWFFVHPDKTSNFNFGNFRWAFILFSLALCFDLLHYGVATATWGIYHHYKEHRVNNSEEFKAPECLNWVPILLLILKVVSTVSGYYLLIQFTILGNAFK